MTDFRVEVRTIDGSLGTIDHEGGYHAFAQTAPVAPELFGGDLRACNVERQRLTQRLAVCWNAFAGIPDPQAYAAAFEAMVEALGAMTAHVEACHTAFPADPVSASEVCRGSLSFGDFERGHTALQAARIARGDA